jgi:hypothetical protein
MDELGSFLAYFYLLRIPLMCWLFLAVLPFFSVPRHAVFGSMLRGIFDLSGRGTADLAFSLFQVTFVSLMTAAAVGVAARLILLDGEERFRAGPVPKAPGMNLIYRLIPMSAPLPLIFFACWETFSAGNVTNWFALVFGALAIAFGGVTFFWVMTWLHKQLWNLAIERPDEVRNPIGRQALIGVTNPILDALAYLAYGLLWAARRIVLLSPAGYTFPNTKKIKNRHSFAVIQLFLSLLVYGVLYFAKRNRIPEARPPVVPTLCLLLVMVMLACMALSALTFFLDRYRIPILAFLGIYAWLFSALPQDDHFYASIESNPIAVAAQGCSPRDGKPMVLVAASGGGIQSAAWTALVLSGLKNDLQGQGSEFDCSIRLISSVSGGSVGAMHFADGYGPEGTLPTVNSGLSEYRPLVNAEASSLDEVAWGLAYQDLPWTLVPFLRGVGFQPFTVINGGDVVNDRGTALENAWKLTEDLKSATLFRWRDDAQRGRRPALIFNSTIVETGERLLLSTTNIDLSSQPARKSSNGRQESNSLYPMRDVPIVTAARLSATFPYVTPAPRIWRGDTLARDYHVADGGYYDNYGIVSLLDWLDAFVRGPEPLPSKVIIVQIRGFPTRAPSRPVTQQGFIFQALAPLQTLLQVRDTGQFSHNEVDMEFAQRAGSYPFPVKTVEFEFNAEDEVGDPIEPPLSWHLTPSDKAVLLRQWQNSVQIQTGRSKFKELLAP